jgi:DNA-binding CsgD family transcriptional regulator
MPLPGLSGWLQFLATLPAPHAAFAALVRGPLAAYGAQSGALWRLADDTLIRLATYGHTRAESSGSGSVPLDLDFAVTRAVRADRFEEASVEVNARDSVAANRDVVAWRQVADRLDARVIGNAPVRHDGRVIGAFGFICNRDVHWTDSDKESLLAVGSALGLWLTHPLLPAAGREPLTVEMPLNLTRRQQQILLLAEQGMASEVIAWRLRYSLSTVKSDLSAAMRALGVHDRDSAAALARRLGLLDQEIDAAELTGDSSHTIGVG